MQFGRLDREKKESREREEVTFIGGERGEKSSSGLCVTPPNQVSTILDRNALRYL